MQAMAIENKNNLFSQNTGETTGAAKTNSGRRVVSWPSREEVWKYCDELESLVDPDKFFDYYDKRNWQTASGPVYDWQALFRAWDKKEFRRTPKKKTFSYRYGEQPINSEDIEDFMRDDKQQEELNRILNKIKSVGNVNAQ